MREINFVEGSVIAEAVLLRHALITVSMGAL
jgi:hypothetical protein